MQRLYSPEISRPRPEWWPYSLFALFSLFVLEIIASLKSIRKVWREAPGDPYTNTIPDTSLTGNVLETDSLESTGLEAHLQRYEVHDEVWGSRTTRLYVVIVMYCAVVGLLSRPLPKPFWFGIILWGMPFASAYFLARSWSRTED